MQVHIYWKLDFDLQDFRITHILPQNINTINASSHRNVQLVNVLSLDKTARKHNISSSSRLRKNIDLGQDKVMKFLYIRSVRIFRVRTFITLILNCCKLGDALINIMDVQKTRLFPGRATIFNS